MKPKKHPSGLTMQRWVWPFKTPEERVVVAAYMKRVLKQAEERERASRRAAIENIEPSPF